MPQDLLYIEIYMKKKAYLNKKLTQSKYVLGFCHVQGLLQLS